MNKAHLHFAILRGDDPFSTLDNDLIQRTSLVVCTHPRRRDLFKVIKARSLPGDVDPRRVVRRNITRKTLSRLIEANL